MGASGGNGETGRGLGDPGEVGGDDADVDAEGFIVSEFLAVWIESRRIALCGSIYKGYV